MSCRNCRDSHEVSSTGHPSHCVKTNVSPVDLVGFESRITDGRSKGLLSVASGGKGLLGTVVSPV